MTLGRSWPVGTINLTGVAVNATGDLTWAASNQTPTLGQYQTNSNGWIELVNMSACLLDIRFPSGDAQPLPPGSWRTFELGLADNSLHWMALTNTQNAANNNVYAYYYPLSSGPPPTGQVVNQSQALAAAAQLNTQFGQANAGTASAIHLTIGPSATAGSFLIQSVTVAFQAGGGGTVGIGRTLHLDITQVGGGTLWLNYVQEQNGGILYPVGIIVPNATPGITAVTINLFQTYGSLQFTANTVLSIISSTT